MDRNFYDMTKVTGKSVSDSKRIQAQSAEFLANYDRSLKESIEMTENAKTEAAMSGARFGYASTAARSAARVNKLNEEIRYTNSSSITGMTEMVAQVVESGLLLDESELVKICPEYKTEIREIVKDFLSEGDLNSKISNEKTLAIMEYVSRQLPSAREGISLTEDELSNYIAVNTPVDINKSIRDLGGDVASRVATLMEKEQKKADQIEKDVKRAKAKAEKGTEATAEDLITALESGQITEKNLEEMLKNGEISQDTYDEVINVYEDAANGAIEEEQPEAEGEAPVTTSAEAPAEEEMPAEDPNAMAAQEAPVDPAMAGEEQPMPEEMPAEDPNAMAADPAAQGVDPTAAMTAPTGMPKKQVQMLPDGTMTINIFETEDFSLVRETPRCGLIESLAVNEATTMINEGKGYNGDLCLAKAIMYVTITEAMDEMGLMNVDEKKYSQIISAAGGKNLTEGLFSKQKGEKNSDTKKDKKIPEGHVLASTATPLLPKKNKGEKNNLTESVLVSQYAPKRNDSYQADSLAERIRQKRLNESQSQILEERASKRRPL